MFDIPLWTPEVFKSNELEYREFLKDSRNWRKIPLLNHAALHEITDSSLVRFRGMVQDMMDAEIYLEKYEVKSKEVCRIQDGKYYDCLVLKDDENVDFNSSSNVHGERRTMFVISVPGINSWASEFENNITKERLQNQESRNECPMGSGQKRPIAESNEAMEIDSVEINESKRVRIIEPNHSENASKQILSREYLLNSPLNDRPSRACMIKIYSDFESFSLNSIVDVVGFLSVNPMLDGTTEQPVDFENAMTYQAANPPPSLIPRLHAIVVNKLDHINPLLDISIMDNDISDINTEAIHKDLMIVLTQCLFGDSIAAEYLLSHLISNVYVRTELLALGQFSINISNIPREVLSDYTHSLYEIIECLLPASHYFPMTLSNMNTLQFTPKKDYNTNKLISGILQLAPHTHLVVDETKLEAGKLEANGVLGVQSLAHLIKTQQFKCNFEFYELDYNTNVPVLILSEGKSMLPSDCHISLKSDPDCVKLIMETMKAAKHYLQPKLNLFRRYLTAARIQEFNMNPTNSEMIQQDFVEMRKSDKTVGADYLHTLLVLSRLLGIARGRNVLDKISWEIAKDLELERRTRLVESKRN